MEISVLVKSSSRKEPYAVVVVSGENGLLISCDCPAGERGQYCKHKIAIVLADEKIFYNGQHDNLQQIKELISQSSYPKLAEELSGLEVNLEMIKNDVKTQKKRIARLMKDGLG